MLLIRELKRVFVCEDCFLAVVDNVICLLSLLLPWSCTEDLKVHIVELAGYCVIRELEELNFWFFL